MIDVLHIVMARKPLDGTIANNVLKHGVGGINIDACRISLGCKSIPKGSDKRVYAKNRYTEDKVYGDNKETSPLGRFTTNIIHDGSEDVLAVFPNRDGGKFPGETDYEVLVLVE